MSIENKRNEKSDSLYYKRHTPMNIAFIPARCGSKSIPFKNIKDFCGKPLLYWNIKALVESKIIDKIVVATDCKKIKEIVEGFNFSSVEVYDRDVENAVDTSSTESVMLEFLHKKTFSLEDNFFLVQATSPLTTSEDFKSAFELFNAEKADSLLTCVKLKKFFWTPEGIPINYDYKNRPRRQDFDGILAENGAFYINKVGNILRDKNRLSGKIAVYEMSEENMYEIDEPNDWVILERLMQQRENVHFE